ncbi:MAG: PilZ domain-containing protein [Candidatus Acidiferrales bacterium]
MPERSQDTDESRTLIRESALYPMTSNVAWSERRQTMRTTLGSVVYINFDSDNGGIVLNVSEGGLCFHSVAPIQREGALRFWFSEHKQRIEADGEIAWIDETRKTGGLRFTALPAEGHEQIRNWISQPVARLAVERPPARSVPPPAPSVPPPARSVASASPAFSAIPPDVDMALEPLFPAVHLSEEADSPDLPADDSPEIKVASLTGFSRGLATGLFVSALVALPCLLFSNRRELGVSLIRLGERLAARSGTQTRTVTPAQPNVLPRLQSSSPTPKQIPVSPPEKVPSPPTINPAKSQQAKIEQPPRIAAAHAVTGGLAGKTPGAAATISSSSSSSSSSRPPEIPSPTTAAAAASNVIPNKIGAVPPDDSANRPGVHAEATGKESAGSSPAGYFEVGKFKDNLLADKAADKVRQLGFHASVVQKGRLWMNSYSVLVGPYGDNQDAEAARKDLVLHGFNPRAFEKGSRDFLFPLALTLNGTQVPIGDYTISWENYSPDAVVKLVKDYFVVATAEAKWIKRDATYPHNAIVWKKGVNGSRTLLEIRFSGMSRALVFRTSP